MVDTRLFPAVSLNNLFLVLRPRTYIASQPLDSGIVGRVNRAKRVLFLGIFFLFNTVLLLYPYWGSVSAGELLLAFLAITGVMFWVYYALLFVTGNRADIITTFRSVVYCTGVYLAALFTVLVTMSGAGTLASGEVLFDRTAGGIPLNPLLGLAFLYFVYAVYHSTRIRHGASRVEGGFVTVGSTVLAVLIPYGGMVVFSQTRQPEPPAFLMDWLGDLTGFSDPGLFVIGEVFVVLVVIFLYQAVIRRYQ